MRYSYKHYTYNKYRYPYYKRQAYTNFYRLIRFNRLATATFTDLYNRSLLYDKIRYRIYKRFFKKQ
ncbi:MAG: hypothetical protein ARM1_0194 [Candidatus Micrarchaeota archaeon]|nr:MAG: hypothetical protein ARM1_0194 [Candidatus Micrarchaeota archaeon]